MAVASAGPYLNHLHLAPGRQPHHYLTTQFLQAGCPSCRPTNSVKALKALGYNIRQLYIDYVVTYGCESWTVRKNEETRIQAFDMKGLRKILRVSWTAKKNK